MLAARLNLVVDGGVVGPALVRMVWTDDSDTLVSHEVAHYSQQAELSTAIQQGLQALRAGDKKTATVRLGHATRLAARSGHDGTVRMLRKVVDVEDERAGTVRIRRQVDKADEMELETRSTRTLRVRKDDAATHPHAFHPDRSGQRGRVGDASRGQRRGHLGRSGMTWAGNGGLPLRPRLRGPGSLFGVQCVDHRPRLSPRAEPPAHCLDADPGAEPRPGARSIPSSPSGASASGVTGPGGAVPTAGGGLCSNCSSELDAGALLRGVRLRPGDGQPAERARGSTDPAAPLPPPALPDGWARRALPDAGADVVVRARGGGGPRSAPGRRHR